MVFENLGDLELDQAAVWTNASITDPWGTAIVARRVRFDSPAEGGVMMSLWPTGQPQDATLFLHNDGGGSFTTSVDDGRNGLGLALERFLPCQLGLVATFDDSTPNAMARVMYLDDHGKITNTPAAANYELTYTQNRPTQAWGVASGRFNRDDRWDIVVAFGNGGPAAHHGGGIAVFRNDGANPGSFIAPWFFDPQPGASSPGPGPTFVAVADMDGDGSDDIIVSNTRSNRIAVLINLN